MARLAHWLPIIAVPKELHVAFMRDYVINNRRRRTTANACRMRGEKILAGDIPLRRVAALTIGRAFFVETSFAFGVVARLTGALNAGSNYFSATANSWRANRHSYAAFFRERRNPAKASSVIAGVFLSSPPP